MMVGTRIPLRYEVIGDAVMVYDYRVNMYGVGATGSEALGNYLAAVGEYYEELQECEGSLGEHLKQHLTYLRQRSGRAE